MVPSIQGAAAPDSKTWDEDHSENTSILVNKQTSNQEYKNTSISEHRNVGSAVWPSVPVRDRRGSLKVPPKKLHWERRSNRTYRIDAETHDMVGDAATLIQRRSGYKVTRDDIAEWALRWVASDIVARGMESEILRDILAENVAVLSWTSQESTGNDDNSSNSDEISGTHGSPSNDGSIEAQKATVLQEYKNTSIPENKNTSLPYFDSNHPSINVKEGDDISSRSRVNKNTSIPAFSQHSNPASLPQQGDTHNDGDNSDNQPYGLYRGQAQRETTRSSTGLPSSQDLARWRVFIEDFQRGIGGDPERNRRATAGQLEMIRRRSGLDPELFAQALYAARERYYKEANTQRLRNPWAFFVSLIQEEAPEVSDQGNGL